MHLLFAVIVIVELLGRLLDNIQMEYLVKPLIMIWIAVYFMLFAKKTAFTIPVLLAFFFSWVGDNLLMLSGKNELFFFAGWEDFFVRRWPIFIHSANTVRQGGRDICKRIPGWLSFFLPMLPECWSYCFQDLRG